MEGPWTKWGVVIALVALLVTYVGTSAQLHWFPFQQSTLTPSSTKRVSSTPGVSPSAGFASPTISSTVGQGIALETGQYYFINDESGSCLNQDYGGYVPHPDVLAFECYYAANELWNVTRNSSGTYSFMNADSKECLNQNYASGVPLANVIAYQCGANANQNWQAMQKGGYIYLVNQESGDCLDQDYGGGVAHEDILAYSPCDYGLNEGWTEKSAP
jgi:hypothetical protein